MTIIILFVYFNYCYVTKMHFILGLESVRWRCNASVKKMDPKSLGFLGPKSKSLNLEFIFIIGCKPAITELESYKAIDTQPHSWTGTWESCKPEGCSTIKLVQKGNTVTGSSSYKQGKITGNV